MVLNLGTLYSKLKFFFIIQYFLVPISGFALDVPPHTNQVIDLAHVLSSNEQQILEGSLRHFQNEYGPQLQVLTIPSLQGEPIESYSIKVVDQWKLGDKKKDDGLLLLVVPEDRQTRIEVGQGLEGVLPDVLAGRIIRDVMIPYFKKNQYYVGISAGLQAIASRLGGTLKDVPHPTSPQRQQQGSVSSGLILLLFIFIFFIFPRFLTSSFRRSPYSNENHTNFLIGFILGEILGSNRKRRRGGFDDFDGGFGGGGGGGFSGGGASGKW